MLVNKALGLTLVGGLIWYFVVLLFPNVYSIRQQNKPEMTRAVTMRAYTAKNKKLRNDVWHNILGDVVDWIAPTARPYGKPNSFYRSGGSAIRFDFEFYSLGASETASNFLNALGFAHGDNPRRFAVVRQWTCSTQAQEGLVEILSSVSPPLTTGFAWGEIDKIKTKERVRELIYRLEEFQKRFSEERDIVGYARLYALSLKVAFPDNYEEALRQANSLIRDYTHTPRIAMMSLWYKGVLQVWFQKKEGLDTFRELATRYKDSDWWVVASARVLASRNLPNLQEVFLPKGLIREQWKPDNFDRVHYNLYMFFQRKRAFDQGSWHIEDNDMIPR